MADNIANKDKTIHLNKRLQPNMFRKGKVPGVLLMIAIAFIAHTIGVNYPIIGGAITGIIIGILIKYFFWYDASIVLWTHLS